MTARPSHWTVLLLALFALLSSAPDSVARNRSTQQRQAQARNIRTRPSSGRRGGWQVAGADVAAYAGARYHVDSSILTELPYTDGDITAAIGLEFHDSAAYWQLLLGGMRNPGDREAGFRQILTPQLNLLLKDRAFVGGVGILRSYLSTDAGPSGWSKFYYQFVLGYEFPLGDRFAATAMAIYPFARWGRIRDFEFGDMEYTAGFSFRF